jgi:hypothetical protein
MASRKTAPTPRGKYTAGNPNSTSPVKRSTAAVVGDYSFDEESLSESVALEAARHERERAAEQLQREKGGGGGGKEEYSPTTTVKKGI